MLPGQNPYNRDKQVLGPFDSGLYMLYLAAFPLLLILFQGSVLTVVGALFQLVLFALALWLIWSGQKAHAAYDAAEVARRPRLPRKLVGSVLIGFLVLILAGLQFHTFGPPLGLALTATSLSIAAFRPDPLRHKGIDDPKVVLRQRTAELTGKADAMLDAIVADIAALEDDDLTLRSQAMRSAVSRLVRMAANDTAVLGALRKPLRRFLKILAEETIELVDAWDSDRHAYARHRFVAKMTALTRAFEAKARAIGLNDGRDEFELEADLLIERIPQRPAA
ncbi:hypothetical protein [Aestuariicoccus sp. MJ-SS9]|uniref:hypothetical protein n=1 Tax=Aestuariicoccus sp. MJ-SS9 TaxID=3079855 RepID=UPI002912CD5E|nr:hypothetical protein [Aestuariicoccus sp. MJ-SS9]MDU8909850.1 hypothetical protein [Aestuariicoccus sp. MJ-SS9]